MTYVLGLTGSIGMGKSTTAQMFRDLGHPVWDADEAVHRLYAEQGAAVAPVSAMFPTALSGAMIDRAALRQVLARDDQALARLESIVHPLVARDRQDFIAMNADAPLVVLDIPLLFESASPLAKLTNPLFVVEDTFVLQEFFVPARAYVHPWPTHCTLHTHS